MKHLPLCSFSVFFLRPLTHKIQAFFDFWYIEKWRLKPFLGRFYDRGGDTGIYIRGKNLKGRMDWGEKEIKSCMIYLFINRLGLV